MSAYFRQWLAGTDFAVADPVAAQMANYAYAVGDRATRTAVLVDPAYDVAGLLALLDADEYRCVGAVATHYHPDHVGGTLLGYRVRGIAELLERADVPVHAQLDELAWIRRTTGVSDALVGHADRDELLVGDVAVTLLHTPGHTPGSQCLLVDGRLVTGDTLFLDGCGRTDLPGGDVDQMYETLTRRLATIDDAAVVYPGHHYSPEPFLTMRVTRARNAVLAPRTPEEWHAVFG